MNTSRVQCVAVVVCAVLLSCANLAGADQTSNRQYQVELLNKAQRAFDRGVALRASDPSGAGREFRRSAELFGQLVDGGVVNGKLLYNLGNAYLESGQLGQAILHYRMAERYIPGNARLEANLSFARSLCRNQFAEAGGKAVARTLFFWHYTTPLYRRFHIAVVCYSLLWVVLIVRLFVRRVRWRYVVIPLLVVTAALAVSVGVDVSGPGTRSEGVVIDDNVVVRKGNGVGFEPQFREKLHEGVEFTVLEERADWYHIELPDGKRGWIAADHAGLVRG